MKPSEKREALIKRLEKFIDQVMSEEDRAVRSMPGYGTLVRHPERGIVMDLGDVLHDLRENYRWNDERLTDWTQSVMK